MVSITQFEYVTAGLQVTPLVKNLYNRYIWQLKNFNMLFNLLLKYLTNFLFN